MFIPTANRRAIHEALFADGVLVAVKDLQLGHHFQLKNIPNLHVIKAMQVGFAE
jgi:small subunit ribosomal protein S10e